MGKVRIRFYAAAGLTSATLYIDRIFVSYAIVNRSVGYADGSIWIDTSRSNEGVEPYVDGTADNPVSTLAAATTIADSTGLRIITLLAGSSVVIGQDYYSYSFRGYFAEIDLNGHNVDACTFQGMIITGSEGGTNSVAVSFLNCRIGTSTLGLSIYQDCRLAGTITISQAGDYFFDGCFSAVAGTGTPGFDFGAAIGATNLSFRHYSGGIEILNMGGVGPDVMSLEGEGQLKINANCTDGLVALRGHFFVVDNAAGAVTLSDDANFDKTVLIPEQTADIGALEANDARLDNLDATISSRATQASVDALANITALDVENAVWDADHNDHTLPASYGSHLDIVLSGRSSQQSVDDIDTILTSTGVILSTQQVDDLIKGLLTTGTETNGIETDAENLSIAQFIHSLLRASIDGQTSELVVYKADGQTQWVRIPVLTYADSEPLIAIGTS